MARAIWSGSISFGLVNVPVKAYTAVRDHSVHFHQLDRKSGARVRYEKVSEKSGKEVASDDIELGYEVGRGTYVTVAPDEVEELRPGSTRTIAISDFVDLAEIDPVYYDHTYWLAPDGEGAAQAYHLLEAATEASGRAGIGTVVMRNTQYLAAIRPRDGALAMSTMRFADEVVPKSSVDAIPDNRSKPGAKELRLAEQIIDSLTTAWDPSRYHDTFTDELKDLLSRKAKGESIVVEEAPARPAEVLDLMSALQASLDAAKSPRGASVSKRAAPGKRPASGTRPATTRSTGRSTARSTTSTARSTTSTRSPATRAPAKRAPATKKAPGRRKSA